MVFRSLRGWLVPLLFCSALWADELKINPNHPDQYTVVKGDTLWDISGKFLQHPWRWPQLWDNNRHIKDPHWIYPGDTIYFRYVDGVPRLSFSPFDTANEPNLVPRVRETALEQPIKIIPIDAIKQFLISPKVVSDQELAVAPYVIDFAGEHLIVGAGDRVYVRGIDELQGLNYTIYRPGKPYVSPETQEILGYEAEFIADATAQASGDPATFLIKKSAREIQKGDRLMLTAESEVGLNYFPRPPETQVTGRIIRVMGGVTQIGQRDIVVIDKGSADGLEVGHTLDIYHAGRMVVDKFQSKDAGLVKLPDELSGVLMVFRPFERVSYALVVEANAAIHTNDKVQTP